MDTMSYIIGRNSAGGGGTGSTPSWSDVTNKPFNTVGEGLEVSNGALKEAVPIYHETVTEPMTDSYVVNLEREYTSSYTNEFYEYAEYMVSDIDNTYNGACEISFHYYLGANQVTLSRSTVQNIHNGGTEVFTDSAGLRWHFYFTADGYFHLTCIDNYEGLDLLIQVYYPGSESPSLDTQPIRTEIRNYTNIFKGGFEQGSHLAIATSSNISWSWFEGEGYSLSRYTVNITDWDWANKTEVYTDTNGTTWHLYMEEDLTAETPYVLYAELLGTLPAGAQPYGEFTAEYTYEGEVETYHQLPTEYIPIDNDSIVVTDGKLHANAVRSIGYSDYTGQTGQLIGELNVNGEVVYGIYAPSGSGSTDWDDITNKPNIASGTGNYSVAVNFANTASGTQSFAEGGATEATGNQSHAEGQNTKALGVSSHAEGDHAIAAAAQQHAQGRYNVENRNTATIIFADIVGNGTNDGARSNAEATDWSGNKYLAGNIYTNVIDWSDPQSGSVKLANIPAPPTTDGNYTLAVTVTNGEPSYRWV